MGGISSLYGTYEHFSAESKEYKICLECAKKFANSPNYEDKLKYWVEFGIWSITKGFDGIEDQSPDTSPIPKEYRGVRILISVTPRFPDEAELYFLAKSEFLKTNEPLKYNFESIKENILVNFESNPNKLTYAKLQVEKYLSNYTKAKETSTISQNYYYVLGYENFIANSEPQRYSVNLAKYVSSYISGRINAQLEQFFKNEIVHIERDIEIEKSSPIITHEEDNEHWPTRQRYLLLKELGLQEFFDKDRYSQNSKHKILSIILNCNIDTAKDIINGKRKSYAIQPSDELFVKNYIKEKRIKD